MDWEPLCDVPVGRTSDLCFRDLDTKDKFVAAVQFRIVTFCPPRAINNKGDITMDRFIDGLGAGTDRMNDFLVNTRNFIAGKLKTSPMKSF